MGNCQSGASCAAGMSAPKELNPMDANPAELLNLGPDAEAFFAKGGRSYYDDVSAPPDALPAPPPGPSVNTCAAAPGVTRATAPPVSPSASRDRPRGRHTTQH